MRLRLRTKRQGRANSSKSPLSQSKCLRGVRDSLSDGGCGPRQTQCKQEKSREPVKVSHRGPCTFLGWLTGGYGQVEKAEAAAPSPGARPMVP